MEQRLSRQELQGIAKFDQIRGQDKMEGVVQSEVQKGLFDEKTSKTHIRCPMKGRLTPKIDEKPTSKGVVLEIPRLSIDST